MKLKTTSAILLACSISLISSGRNNNCHTAKSCIAEKGKNTSKKKAHDVALVFPFQHISLGL